MKCCLVCLKGLRRQSFRMLTERVIIGILLKQRCLMVGLLLDMKRSCGCLVQKFHLVGCLRMLGRGSSSVEIVLTRFSRLLWLLIPVSLLEIPDVYFESLPKNGKYCLGEVIYRYVTVELFIPDYLLDCLDLPSEHQILEVANRIEVSVHVRRLKDQKRLAGQSRSNLGWQGQRSCIR